MPDDAAETEISEELRRLSKQQEEVLAAIAAINDRLDAGEWRRKCLWVWNGIGQTTARLRHLFPEREKIFAEMLEALDCYTNVCFKSTEDLHALFTCLSLAAGNLEEAGRDGTSAEDFRHHINLVFAILGELRILEDGYPAGWSHIIGPDDRTIEAERKAVRDRIAERMRESIRARFARRREQRDELD